MAGALDGIRIVDVSQVLSNSAAKSRARGDLVGAATLYRHAHMAAPESAAPLISLGQVNFRGTSFWTRFGRRVAPLIFTGYAIAVIALLLM